MSIFQIVQKGDFKDLDQLRNVHHYEFPGYVPVTTELQEAVDALDAAYKSNLQATFSDTVDFEKYGVRRVDIGGLPEADFVATAGSWSGTDGLAPLPTQVSALVSFKAPTVFPRGSRMYLYPFTEGANNTNGLIDSIKLTAMLAAGSAMLTLVITAQPDATKMAVKYSGTPRAVTASNLLTTVFVNSNWATQRRRRRGVGA